MESVFSTTYLLFCVITIFNVVAAIFAPKILENFDGLARTADGWCDFHSNMFGWTVLIGGIGNLLTAVFDWQGGFIFVQLYIFGIAYFIGLLAHEYDKKMFRMRCRAAYRRYCDALRDCFPPRGKSGPRRKPDFAFMKKVEAFSTYRFSPECEIRLRIHFARGVLDDQALVVEEMVCRYVRAGGLP